VFFLSATFLANVFAADEPAPAKTKAFPVGAPKSPREVVMAYVAAANRNDLDAFIALYAPDIKKYRFPATLASEGASTCAKSIRAPSGRRAVSRWK